MQSGLLICFTRWFLLPTSPVTLWVGTKEWPFIDKSSSTTWFCQSPLQVYSLLHSGKTLNLNRDYLKDSIFVWIAANLITIRLKCSKSWVSSQLLLQFFQLSLLLLHYLLPSLDFCNGFHSLGVPTGVLGLGSWSLCTLHLPLSNLRKEIYGVPTQLWISEVNSPYNLHSRRSFVSSDANTSGESRNSELYTTVMCS